MTTAAPSVEFTAQDGSTINVYALAVDVVRVADPAAPLTEILISGISYIVQGSYAATKAAIAGAT